MASNGSVTVDLFSKKALIDQLGAVLSLAAIDRFYHGYPEVFSTEAFEEYGLLIVSKIASSLIMPMIESNLPAGLAPMKQMLKHLLVGALSVAIDSSVWAASSKNSMSLFLTNAAASYAGEYVVSPFFDGMMKPGTASPINPSGGK